MTTATSYRIQIGKQTISSNTKENERLLLSLCIRLGMDGFGGSCEMTLGDVQNTLPQTGDSFSVELDIGNGVQAVFTGVIDSVCINSSSLSIIAFDSLNKLLTFRTEASYENVDVDFVVKDVLQQAGVNIGRVVKGFRMASYVLTRNTGALAQVLELAQWCGADLYTDGKGKAHFITPAEKGKELTFHFATNIKQMEIMVAPPVHDSIEVFGEGAASSKGAEKYYWLTKDLSGVSGKSAIDEQGVVSTGKLGKRPRHLNLGAVRSGESAQYVAQACMKAQAARWLRGRMAVFGTPGVLPGDTIKIENIPDKHQAALLLQTRHSLRVRQVKHSFNRTLGFMTQMEF